jgi:hypothetical protein
MATTVNCRLPNPVQDYLRGKYGSPQSALLDAAKAYTQQPNSRAASAVVTRKAQEWECCKTDVYRKALISFDPAVEDLWPPAERTAAQIEGAHSYMVDDSAAIQPALSGRARLIKTLRALAAATPKLNPRQVQARLHAIADKLENPK